MTPHTGIAEPSPSAVHLDAVRGAAALLVVIYHVRYNFFLDYGDLTEAGVGARLFYAVTSFGHDAVMVFFVLSGYLVGGSVLKDLGANRWSWPRYLTRRATRLYVVLVPALLLTACWDSAGLRLFPDHVAYTGAPQAWRHDFVDVRSVFGATVAAKNAVFMQGFRGTPPLGTNIPLWSLAYEAAYYIMFPALAVALWPSSKANARMGGGAIAVGAAFWFGPRIVLYFAVWLLGVAIKALSDVRRQRAPATWQWPLAFALFCAGTLVRHTGWFRGVTASNDVILGDFLVGLTFAVALLAALRHPWARTWSWYSGAARNSATISYSLYATHMPLLIFMRAWWNPGASWSPGVGSVLVGVAAAAAAVLQATILYLIFERHTPRLQEAIARTWAPAR